MRYLTTKAFHKAFIRGFLSDMAFYLLILAPLAWTLWMVT
jgi:hypothetical protein